MPEEIEPLPDGIDFNLMRKKINEIVEALKEYGIMARIGGTPESLGDFGLGMGKAGPADVEKT